MKLLISTFVLLGLCASTTFAIREDDKYEIPREWVERALIETQEIPIDESGQFQRAVAELWKKWRFEDIYRVPAITIQERLAQLPPALAADTPFTEDQVNEVIDKYLDDIVLKTGDESFPSEEWLVQTFSDSVIDDKHLSDSGRFARIEKLLNDELAEQGHVRDGRRIPQLPENANLHKSLADLYDEYKVPAGAPASLDTPDTAVIGPNGWYVPAEEDEDKSVPADKFPEAPEVLNIPGSTYEVPEDLPEAPEVADIPGTTYEVPEDFPEAPTDVPDYPTDVYEVPEEFNPDPTPGPWYPAPTTPAPVSTPCELACKNVCKTVRKRVVRYGGGSRVLIRNKRHGKKDKAKKVKVNNNNGGLIPQCAPFRSTNTRIVTRPSTLLAIRRRRPTSVRAPWVGRRRALVNNPFLVRAGFPAYPRYRAVSVPNSPTYRLWNNANRRAGGSKSKKSHKRTKRHFGKYKKDKKSKKTPAQRPSVVYLPCRPVVPAVPTVTYVPVEVCEDVCAYNCPMTGEFRGFGARPIAKQL